jgi:hypothetical protein
MAHSSPSKGRTRTGIAGTFASIGALTKLVKDCQAQSRVHLRELLAGQERYVFTLIHKFSTADREPMPVLSERDDIIVITDEDVGARRHHRDHRRGPPQPV